MNMMKTISTAMIFVAMAAYVGCNTTPTENDTNNQDNSSQNTDENHDDHDHEADHGHSHDDDGHGHEAHAHGPNNGEYITFEGAEFRGEIATTKGEDTLTIYILDGDEDVPRPIKAEKIVAKQSKGRDAQTFEFMAVEADDDGMASKFVIDENAATLAYNAFGFEIEVTIGDETFKADVEKNPHAGE